jgi:transposase
MQITTIGLDLAKRVFQIHCVDADGRVVIRRKLQRAEVADFFAGLPHCLVGIEACATAHHWARLIEASGHQVRLIPPSYVKPYIRRSKTDAAELRRSARRSDGLEQILFIPAHSQRR